MADIKEDGSEVFHYDIPDFPLSIKRNFIPANVRFTDMSIHWHDEIEITYVVSGRVRHQLNGKMVTINAGEAIYINSRQLHLIVSDDSDCELYCLIFHPTMLCASNHIARKYVYPIVENENLDYYFLNDSDENHKTVLDAIRKIREYEDEDNFEMKATAKLYDLWQNLYGILPKAKTSELMVNEDLHRVQRMLAVIQKEYPENLDLDDICRAGNVGKTKGTKLFNQYLNMTPVEYLINYRLEVASQILKKTNDSVVDIAMATGFSDSSYFARIFRKRIGEAPLEYRARVRREEKN